jgi:hypothetical protein
MLTRLALATVVVSLPTLALAQSATSAAAVCDGSEIRHAERVRAVGRTLFGATALADLVAVLTIPHNPGGAKVAGSHFRVVGATAPIAIGGLFIAGRAAPGDGFWDRVISRMKVGETKSADVRLCLQRPLVKTSNGTEERWTYVMARPVGLIAPSLHSLRLTFRDSVLAEVLTTEVNRSAMTGGDLDSTGLRPFRHHGFCAPPIPVVADAFPTPIDTSAAAAAMARAQADADAAMKNSAAAAAYAACMVSDSAR